MLVDAIETAFVPLLIHNNRPGVDAALLKRFQEPSWNYQVVRFLDQKGADLIPRKDKVWTLGPLAGRMIAALVKARRPVPNFLRALADGQQSRIDTSRVALAMHCFWTGERLLGQLEGVISTEAGWLDGREVVLVTFDPKRITAASLLKKAKKLDSADKVFTDLKGYRKAKARDQKRQIPGTRLERIPLSLEQATKVNAWVREDLKKALSWLSPAQSKALGE